MYWQPLGKTTVDCRSEGRVKESKRRRNETRAANEKEGGENGKTRVKKVSRKVGEKDDESRARDEGGFDPEKGCRRQPCARYGAVLTVKRRENVGRHFYPNPSPRVAFR